ncbi:MAG: tRNA uridine-5-carboxymethylaminomethyl(34) synthesis GTPase MnmE [Alphaproteobacteria bacterium]
MSDDTIFALASGAGRAGIAVYRISGPGAGTAFTALTGRALPAPRHAVRIRVGNGVSGDIIDDGIGLWFQAPESFTGEDVAELHLHGGPAVMAAVTEALGAIDGLRLAEPGEFSRRAFENGKFDLTQAEGLADLVNAETESQRRQARRQFDGALAAMFEDWRARLIAALAGAEAAIDFVDEEDVPADLMATMHHKILGIKDEITQYLDDNHRGERLRDGIYIAILGAPNVGKSSLLNGLARREAAIVSEIAGTTRDVIEVHLNLGGVPVIVADTAGLGEAGDEIEGEGIRRARARAADADVKLTLFDAQSWPQMDDATRSLVDGDTIIVVNKADLADPSRGGAGPLSYGDRPVEVISVLRGDGMAALLQRIETEVAGKIETAGPPALTRARHRRALEDCAQALTRCQAADAAELVAEDLRLAARALGRITGRIDVEDVLDAIFKEFCIGK